MTSLQRRTTSHVAFGLMGSMAGLAVMDWVMKRTAPLVGEDDREHESVSLIGTQHREGESSTTALGRHVYAGVTGREPDEDRKEKLGYAAHYAQGMTMGALYGALRADRERPYLDVAGGALFGLGLWAVADETVVPLLGLKDSFSSYPPSQHLQALGGHLAYGVATAAASQLLRLGLKRL
jgi:hypothetical protein